MSLHAIVDEHKKTLFYNNGKGLLLTSISKTFQGQIQCNITVMDTENLTSGRTQAIREISIILENTTRNEAYRLVKRLSRQVGVTIQRTDFRSVVSLWEQQ